MNRRETLAPSWRADVHVRLDGSTNREAKGRRGLPHIDLRGAAQSITIRLFDSLPREKLNALRDDLTGTSEEKQKILLGRRIEEWIDLGAGSCLLADERVAAAVEESLLCFHAQRYDLHDWTIMPNHLHMLLTLLNGFSLSAFIKSFKAYTARKANLVLGRSGQFWAADYFDRYIRDEKHFEAVESYIQYNPVSAGLCLTPGDWRFGSAWSGRKWGDKK